MLFFLLLDNVVFYQKSRKIFPQKIRLDFDEQGSAGRFAIEWFDKLRDGVAMWSLPAEHKEIIEATPKMVGSKEYVSIQAADLLAWTTRASLEGVLDSKWAWLHEELETTVLAGRGYSKETWEAMWPNP